MWYFILECSLGYFVFKMGGVGESFWGSIYLWSFFFKCYLGYYVFKGGGYGSIEVIDVNLRI